MRLLTALCLGLALASWSAAADAASERIVSAGGDITEIIYALGAGDRIVAVDSTSNHPPEAAKKDQIGYIRRIAAEGVLSLQPDHVIAAHDAGPPTAVEQLRAAGLRVDLAPRGDSPEGISAKIRFVGQVLGLEAEADSLVKRVETDMQSALSLGKGKSDPPRVLFVLSEQEGAPLVGGAETSADAIITLAGGVNAAGSFQGFKPMSREAIIEAAPDVLLMMSQAAARLGGAEAMLARPELSLTPAGRNNRFVTIEGMLLLGFGPRTPEAVRTLADALHAK